MKAYQTSDVTREEWRLGMRHVVHKQPIQKHCAKIVKTSAFLAWLMLKSLSSSNCRCFRCLFSSRQRLLRLLRLSSVSRETSWNRMLHRPLQPSQASVCSWVPSFTQSDFIQTDPEIFPSLQQSQFWNSEMKWESWWDDKITVLFTFTRILTCKVTELTLCVLVWRPQRFAPWSPQSELQCEVQESTWGEKAMKVQTAKIWRSASNFESLSKADLRAVGHIPL